MGNGASEDGGNKGRREGVLTISDREGRIWGVGRDRDGGKWRRRKLTKGRKQRRKSEGRARAKVYRVNERDR